MPENAVEGFTVTGVVDSCTDTDTHACVCVGGNACPAFLPRVATAGHSQGFDPRMDTVVLGTLGQPLELWAHSNTPRYRGAPAGD